MTASDNARQAALTLWWRDRDRSDVLRVVEDLTRQNRSAQEIAEVAGISKSTVMRMRRELGVSGRQNRPWTLIELDRAEQMFEDGCSLSEVARTLGRPISSVRKKFPGRKWSYEETNEYNRALAAHNDRNGKVGHRKPTRSDTGNQLEQAEGPQGS